MSNTLEPGENRVGQIVDDSEDDLPFQSAALLHDEASAALLKIPYLRSEPQFSRTEAWFDAYAPPSSLIYLDDKGYVALSGVRWSGHTGGGRMTGRLKADTAIFSKPRRLKEQYKVREMRSTIDGLGEFAMFEPVRTNWNEIGPAGGLVVTLDTSEEVTWRSAGFTYSVRSNAPWSGTDGQQFQVESVPYLATSKSARATADEHLTAQWSLRALLAMVVGERVAWRGHRVKDESFPTWMLGGDARAAQPVETRLSRTTRDAQSAPVPHDRLALPWLRLRDLGSRGMKRWTDLYDDDLFRRGIEPIAEVLSGASRFLEPQLMMTAIALDYMDFSRDVTRRRLSLAQRIEGCLAAADLDWPQIGTRSGIAKAIAKLNNDLKHPDRLNRPSTVELHCLTDLAIVIARAQLLDFLRLSSEHRRRFLQSRPVYQAVDAFRLNSVMVSATGDLIPAGTS
jgi:hypothetical protein